MSSKLKREEICLFVKTSIENRQFNEELSFLISEITIQRVQKRLHINLGGYLGVISSHSVRHVRRGHPNDIFYICEIPEIIESFLDVRKNITKDSKTGASLVSLEFYKKYDNKTIKLVKLRIYKDKRLELKTIFEKDE